MKPPRYYNRQNQMLANHARPTDAPSPVCQNSAEIRGLLASSPQERQPTLTRFSA